MRKQPRCARLALPLERADDARRPFDRPFVFSIEPWRPAAKRSGDSACRRSGSPQTRSKRRDRATSSASRVPQPPARPRRPCGPATCRLSIAPAVGVVQGDDQFVELRRSRMPRQCCRAFRALGASGSRKPPRGASSTSSSSLAIRPSSIAAQSRTLGSALRAGSRASSRGDFPRPSSDAAQGDRRLLAHCQFGAVQGRDQGIDRAVVLCPQSPQSQRRDLAPDRVACGKLGRQLADDRAFDVFHALAAMCRGTAFSGRFRTTATCWAGDFFLGPRDPRNCISHQQPSRTAPVATASFTERRIHRFATASSSNMAFTPPPSIFECERLSWCAATDGTTIAGKRGAPSFALLLRRPGKARMYIKEATGRGRVPRLSISGR